MSKLLESFVNFGEPFFIMGDFNVHFEPHNDLHANQLRDLLNSHGFHCGVETPTHTLGGIIDLIFSRSCRSSSVTVTDTGLSDHFLLHWKSTLHRPPPKYVSLTFRPWKNLNVQEFRRFISLSTICDEKEWPGSSCDDLVHLFDNIIRKALDQLNPLRTVRLHPRQSDPWFDGDCRLAKQLLRSIERRVSAHDSTSLIYDQLLADWKVCKQIYRKILKAKREEYWRTKVQNESSKPRQLWNSINSLLGRGKQPASECLNATDFQHFFDHKCDSILSTVSNGDSPAFAAGPLTWNSRILLP